MPRFSAGDVVIYVDEDTSFSEVFRIDGITLDYLSYAEYYLYEVNTHTHTFRPCYIIDAYYNKVSTFKEQLKALL